MRRSLMITALLALGACDDGDADAPIDAAPLDAQIEGPDATLPDATLPDATLPDAALPDAALPDAALPDAALPDAALPDAGSSACTPEDRAACVYAPTVRAEPANRAVFDLEYPSITGAPRTFSIEVRAPEGASADTPIVVWSHGGSGGRNDPSQVAPAWGQAFVRAGYVVVAIAHPGHTPESYTALCDALELGFCAPQACMNNGDCAAMANGEPVDGSCDAGTCRFFKPINWDRPNDLRVVLDWIEAEAADGVLTGRADPSRVVYAGHSAGAGSTNMVAGATRQFEPGGRDRLLLDPRPLGFISCSPQGPGDDGFTAASYDRATCAGIADPDDRGACLSRPHLTLTGVDDGGVGASRRESFDLAPAGLRFLGYILEPEAQHTTFNLESDACERVGGTPERCADYLTWLQSAALSFLDAVLRDDARARAYLMSDDLRVLGADGWSWEQR